jgi:hypothetical protein
VHTPTGIGTNSGVTVELSLRSTFNVQHSTCKLDVQQSKCKFDVSVGCSAIQHARTEICEDGCWSPHACPAPGMSRVRVAVSVNQYNALHTAGAHSKSANNFALDSIHNWFPGPSCEGMRGARVFYCSGMLCLNKM